MTITSRPLGRQKFSVVVGQTKFTPIQPVVARGGSGTYTYTMSALIGSTPAFVLPTGGGETFIEKGNLAPLPDLAPLLKANSLLGVDPIIVPPSGTEVAESLLPIRIVESTGVVIITSITHLTAGVYEATITVTDGTSSLVQKFTLEVLANPAPYITTISLSGANYSALDYVQSATLVNTVCEQILAENTSITIYYVNLSEGSVILTVGSSGPFGPPTSTFNLGGGIVLTNDTPILCEQVSVSSSGQYQTIITTNTSGGPGLIYRSTDYGDTWTDTGAPIANWSALGMSASGKYQTACIGGSSFGALSGLIYRSTNYGDTWVATGAPSALWIALSMSASGKYQTACRGELTGPIYLSTNYGDTWDPVPEVEAPSAQWQALSMSESGQYQTACSSELTGRIYVSTNYGANWDPVPEVEAPSDSWRVLSMSASGQYQTACSGDLTGRIYVSTNYGDTWDPVPEVEAPSAQWQALSMSESGQYQTACVYGGLIYRSTNYGANWTDTGAPITNWSALGMSASGQYQTACRSLLSNGLIYVSTNYGANWEALPGSPTDAWTSTGMSSDGQYQTAVGFAGVYTWTNVICLLETCNLMLTDGSYKNVKDIKTGDILRSALNGTDLRVLHCGYNVVRDLSRVPASNHPMCIPEGFFAEGSPSRDVFISGHHRLFFTLNETTVGIQVFKLLPETNTLTMDKALEAVGSDVLKYYHVEVEGGKNAVFCDGLPVETLEAGEWESSRIEN